jgi:thiol-disulfide isomerase/thioredoxin
MRSLQATESRALDVGRLLVLVLAALLGFASHAAAIETPQNFVLRDSPQPLPEVAFADGDGRPGSLADFRGKVVLLNIWATWCLPCRKEMPTLDRLQAHLGGPDFEVVAISIDRKGAEAVRNFFAEIGVMHISVRVDPSGESSFALGAFGLPVTLLIDRQGRELGRLQGPAAWDAPDTAEFLKSIIARKESWAIPGQPKEPT